jgi:hypothetical protein
MNNVTESGTEHLMEQNKQQFVCVYVISEQQLGLQKHI